MDQKKKLLELKQKWNDIWDYFEPAGFEDILLCKVMELKNAKTREMKLDECFDIIQFTNKYHSEILKGRWKFEEYEDNVEW